MVIGGREERQHAKTWLLIYYFRISLNCTRFKIIVSPSHQYRPVDLAREMHMSLLKAKVLRGTPFFVYYMYMYVPRYM